jgi:hypothetical protein
MHGSFSTLQQVHHRNRGVWLFAPMRMYRVVAALVLLACARLTCADIVVDGVINEAEWDQATNCNDWQRTLPFALDAARYRNQLKLLATDQGLAAAFIIDQPTKEERMRPRTPRDAEAFTGDSVALIVDFDATAQVGYEFAVALGGGVRDGLVTNQNKFARDWDGTWQHAVRETEDQWIVEILIPWSTISMRPSAEPRRTIAVYASRYLFSRGERYSCPGISSDSNVFLSDFRRVEVAGHATVASLDFTPYGSALLDQLNDDTKFKAGADLVWKPSPNTWLAATLNPDFGQVESDELVINFSGIETVFTDKRPFFTSNQGTFDLRTPANGQLIYTRRVGGPVDDGRAGVSDIDAAVKLTGNAGRMSYGAFVAQEDDYSADVGRLFAATRVALPFEHARIGHLATWADRPFLDRTALLNAIDYEITPSEQLRFAGQVIRSDIDQASVTDHGYEAWFQTDINRASPITHTLRLLYIDDRFDMNDLGYLERNSLRQAELDTYRRIASTQLDSRVSGETQRLYLLYKENTLGQRLQSRILVSRDLQYATAWRFYTEARYIPSGVDDQISRGNGPVQLDARIGAYFDLVAPRFGDWQFQLGSYLFQQGVSGYSGYAFGQLSWFLHEKLTLRLSATPQWSEDWLVWQQGNLFGAFESDRLDFDFRMDWIPAPRHEIRLKLQWIGIDAELGQAYRTDPRGNLLKVTDTVPDFTISNLGLQIRYRYEFGPQSELFLVYGRGGFDFVEDDPRSLNGLLRDVDRVRDADQFFVKVRYRL